MYVVLLKLKLDGKRATARSAYTQNEGRNRRNRMKENVSNQETPRQNGEGGRAPKHERSIEAESAGGEGKNAGRQSGRLKAVNQGSDKAHKNPVSKMRCRAAKEML
ncbi:hypothetical protein TNCV_2444041 [Trichonephila clavipes]|nr:hypothetical protein TNCV_2444041 [Trichonephila clavipes]